MDTEKVMRQRNGQEHANRHGHWRKQNMDQTTHPNFGALVPIEETDFHGEPTPTVDARKLHASLGSGKDFHTWFKGRVNKFKFQKGNDFIVLPRLGENSGGRPAIEYYVTLDMAKEMAMVENTTRGREVRQYFIECEKRLRAIQPPQALSEIDLFKRTLAVFEQQSAQIEKLDSRISAIDNAGDPYIAMYDRVRKIGSMESEATGVQPQKTITQLWRQVKRSVGADEKKHYRHIPRSSMPEANKYLDHYEAWISRHGPQEQMI